MQRPGAGPHLGVRNAVRLAAVRAAYLEGHLGDPDLDAVVATLHLACHAPMAVVNIVSPDLQTYVAEVGVGAACSNVTDDLSFCAEVVDTGQSLTVSDAAAHPHYSRNPLVRDGSVGAYAGVPLVDDGVVLGSVSIFDRRARSFSPEVLQILGHQARLAATVLALRRSARQDALTGLANRALFEERLSRALARRKRHHEHLAVMFVDLDGFKGVNDTYGHAVGDEVLVELARRFCGVLRPDDTLARFGGDEFVLLCEDLDGPSAAEVIAQRLLDATRPSWITSGGRLDLSVSIGIAVTDSPGTPPADLLGQADAALYEAKARPGAAFAVSAPVR